MRAYIAVTGGLFALLIVVHVWRVFEEGPHLLREPSWMLVNALALGMCVWAARLLRGGART